MSVDISATLKERGNNYGRFVDHALITQHIKAVFREYDGWTPLTNSQKEALEMIAHKIGRVLNGNPNLVDHWVDIAGYAQLVANELDGEYT